MPISGNLFECSWLWVAVATSLFAVAEFFVLRRLYGVRSYLAAREKMSTILAAEVAERNRIELDWLRRFGDGTLYGEILDRCRNCFAPELCAKWLADPGNFGHPVFCKNADAWDAVLSIYDRDRPSPDMPDDAAPRHDPRA